MKQKRKHKSKGKGLLIFVLVLIAIGFFSSGGNKTKQSAVNENTFRSSVIIQSASNDPTAEITRESTQKPTATPRPTKTTTPILTATPTTIETAVPTAFATMAPSHAATDTPTKSPIGAPTATVYVPPRTPSPSPSSSREGTNKNAVFPQTTAQTTPVPGTNYVLNGSSGVFHYPSCKDVKKMQDKNRIDFFGTREEVIAKGYRPCGHCKP